MDLALALVVSRHPTYPPQCGSFRHIGPLAAETVANLAFRRKVELLHSLGPRVTAELLAEIGVERSIQTVIDQKLETYTALDIEALEATGGDDFSPVPIHEVRRTP